MTIHGAPQRSHPRFRFDGSRWITFKNREHPVWLRLQSPV